jgi:hypothetical protein
MTRDDIIRMAREAGFSAKQSEIYFDRMLYRFAVLVAAAEREACAQAAQWTPDQFGTAQRIAAAIRARGQT